MQKDDESKSAAKLLGWLFGVVCLVGIIAVVVGKSGDAPGWKIADNERITNVETRVEVAPKPVLVKVISVTCTKPELSVEPVTFTTGVDGIAYIHVYDNMINIQRKRTSEHTKSGKFIRLVMSLEGCVYTDKWILKGVE